MQPPLRVRRAKHMDISDNIEIWDYSKNINGAKYNVK